MMTKTVILGAFVAQAGIETLPGGLGSIVQGGAVAALIGLLWWKETKGAPAREQAFAKALNEQNIEARQVIKEIMADSAANRIAFLHSLETIRDEIRKLK